MRIIILFIIASLAAVQNNHDKATDDSEQSGQTPIVSFGVISDLHYCEYSDYNSRYYSKSLSKLDAAAGYFNQLDLDFIVNLGDLIDRDFKSYDSVLTHLATLKSPLYNVLGNHDFTVDQRFRGRVSNRLNTGIGYYSFSSRGFRFIILNTNDISLYSPERRNRAKAEDIMKLLTLENRPNAYEWNGTIGDQQTKWMIAELDKAASGGEKVIIFSHHPAWPESQFNILDYQRLLDIIVNYDNVGAWFSGHNHDGGYGNYNLVHFVTFRGMVETEDLNSFAVVELYRNKIWIKGTGREKSQILAW